MPRKTDLFGNDVTNKGLSTGYLPEFKNNVVPAAKDKKKKKDKPSTKLLSYNYNPYKGSTSSGGSYSASGTRWYDVTKGDISGLLQSYEDQAASARNTATSTYNTTRNDLLTALKRYQEKNASDVLNQKQSYLTEQASLESARESANRQSRISAAARGLGGSGLQQLAQLQNMIGQSEEVSQAANKNQAAMTDLINQLREYTEDNESKQKSNLETYQNTLNSIASTLANQRAEAIANNEQRYIDAINARNAAAAQYSYSSSPGNSESYDYTDAVRGGLTSMEKTLTSALKSASKLKKRKQGAAVESAVSAALKSLDALNSTYGLGKNYNTATKNINSLLKQYKFKDYTI